VITGDEMRPVAAGSLQHLVPIEGEKLPVLPRPPRKGIDAIKSLNVIDPEEVKDAPDSAHPFAPPLTIVRAHGAPAIERNAPFLRERVVLKGRLGRRAARPIKQEFMRARENIGAVVTDAERNIAH